MFIFYFILYIISAKLYALETPHLLQEIEIKRKNYEQERIDHTFKLIDELFKKSIIKIQKLDSSQKITKESTKSLYEFLIKPHKKQAIIDLLSKNSRVHIKQEALEFIKKKEVSSFVQAIHDLWQEKYLALKDANALIKEHSPMSAEEIIRLVENGACLCESGYFVQLRTGNNFGDALKLQDDVEYIFRKIREENKIEIPNEPMLSLIEGSYGEYILNGFRALGMSIPDSTNDAHVLSEMRKYFSFLSTIGNITGFNPNGVGTPAMPNPIEATYMILSPQQLSSALVGNYYLNNIDASLTHVLSFSPLGMSYTGNLAFSNQGADWWLYYSNGYLGGGFDYTINFDQGALWSNGYASYLSVGANISGWKNQLSAGVTMQTLLSKGIGAGASAYVNVAREHDVAFIDTYPIDGKFAAIRGMHQVEINDKIDKGMSAALAFNFSAAGVPLVVAFKAGANLTRARTYRTHTTLNQAQDMLLESDLPNLLFKAGKKIKESRVPSFDHPELLIDGDELIEIKTGRLSGSFIIGLQTVVPIYALRAGTSIDLTAEFELGLRKLPNDKYEVSIEPRRVHEMSLFACMLNILGAGHVSAMAIARKQIFVFDFKIYEAKMAYFDLIHQGRLPSGDEIEASTEDRGPEHLLAEFRAHNNLLKKRGVQRTYLEAMTVNTAKSYAGFNAPIIPAILFLINKSHDALRKNHRELKLQFEGKDREFMRSHSSSVATNGIVAVRKIISGGRVSHGQGFSGRFNQDLFVTHRRIHSVKEKPDGHTENSWAFDSLIIHAQLEDTIITGDQENSMVEIVNRLFSAYIGSFEYKNSKFPRLINLERELKRTDLENLLSLETKERVSLASQASGIEQATIYAFLKKLKNKHSDLQGLIIKQFIEGHPGLNGFSAVHQLLGARVEDLRISTESGYAAAIQDANNFIIKYRDKITKYKSKKNKKIVRAFYHEARMNLRALDQQLRLLYDDKYLIDSNSPLISIFGEQKLQELVQAGVRQEKIVPKSALISARKTILELLDLKAQKFSQEERLLIYRMARKKDLRLAERVEIFAYENFKALKDRHEYSAGVRLLDKINTRITKLSEDQVMNAMDPDYVKNQLALWEMLSRWLTKLIYRS